MYYSYEEFLGDIKILAKKVPKKPDAILGVARGGLTISHFLGIYLDIRNIVSINAISYSKDKSQNQNIEIFNMPDLLGCKNILVVDDIADSGQTMQKTIATLKERYQEVNIKTLCIFYKSSSVFKPDIYLKESNEWIDFFWEVDLFGRA